MLFFFIGKNFDPIHFGLERIEVENISFSFFFDRCGSFWIAWDVKVCRMSGSFFDLCYVCKDI